MRTLRRVVLDDAEGAVADEVGDVVGLVLEQPPLQLFAGRRLAEVELKRPALLNQVAEPLLNGLDLFGGLRWRLVARRGDYDQHPQREPDVERLDARLLV